MKTISLGLPPSPTNTRLNNHPSTLPVEKPKDIDNGKLRQGAVSAIESKQQKELAERFVKATVNANQNIDSDKNVGLGDLQDIAQFARRLKAVQVIDDNDGSMIKDFSENRRDKIENFFREINNSDEVISGQKVDSQA